MSQRSAQPKHSNPDELESASHNDYLDENHIQNISLNGDKNRSQQTLADGQGVAKSSGVITGQSMQSKQSLMENILDSAMKTKNAGGQSKVQSSAHESNNALAPLEINQARILEIQSQFEAKPIQSQIQGNNKTNRDRRAMQMNQAWVGSPVNSIEDDPLNMLSKITKQVQSRFPQTHLTAQNKQDRNFIARLQPKPAHGTNRNLTNGSHARGKRSFDHHATGASESASTATGFGNPKGSQRRRLNLSLGGGYMTKMMKAQMSKQMTFEQYIDQTNIHKVELQQRPYTRESNPKSKQLQLQQLQGQQQQRPQTQAFAKRLNDSQLTHYQQNAATNVDVQNPMRTSLDSREIATDRIRFENQDSALGNESPDQENSYAHKRHNHLVGSKLQFYNTGIVVHRRFNTSVGFYRQQTKSNHRVTENQIMIEDQSMHANIKGIALQAQTDATATAKKDPKKRGAKNDFRNSILYSNVKENSMHQQHQDFTESLTQKTIDNPSEFRISSVQNDEQVANIALINITPNAQAQIAQHQRKRMSQDSSRIPKIRRGQAADTATHFMTTSEWEVDGCSSSKGGDITNPCSPLYPIQRSVSPPHAAITYGTAAQAKPYKPRLASQQSIQMGSTNTKLMNYSSTKNTGEQSFRNKECQVGKGPTLMNLVDNTNGTTAAPQSQILLGGGIQEGCIQVTKKQDYLKKNSAPQRSVGTKSRRQQVQMNHILIQENDIRTSRPEHTAWQGMPKRNLHQGHRLQSMLLHQNGDDDKDDSNPNQHLQQNTLKGAKMNDVGELNIQSMPRVQARLLSNQDIKGFANDGDDYTCDDLINTAIRGSEPNLPHDDSKKIPARNDEAQRSNITFTKDKFTIKSEIDPSRMKQAATMVESEYAEMADTSLGKDRNSVSVSQNSVLKQIDQVQMLEKNLIGMSSICSSQSKMEMGSSAVETSSQPELATGRQQKQASSPKELSNTLKIAKSPIMMRNQQNDLQLHQARKAVEMPTKKCGNYFVNRFGSRLGGPKKIQQQSSVTALPQTPEKNAKALYQQNEHKSIAQNVTKPKKEPDLIQDKNIHEIVIEETILSSKQATVNGTVTVREVDYGEDEHERSQSTRFNSTRKGIFEKKSSTVNDDHKNEMYATQQGKDRSRFDAKDVPTPTYKQTGQRSDNNRNMKIGDTDERDDPIKVLDTLSMQGQSQNRRQEKSAIAPPLSQSKQNMILNKDVPWLIGGYTRNSSHLGEPQENKRSILCMQLLLFERARQSTHAKDQKELCGESPSGSKKDNASVLGSDKSPLALPSTQNGSQINSMTPKAFFKKEKENEELKVSLQKSSNYLDGLSLYLNSKKHEIPPRNEVASRNGRKRVARVAGNTGQSDSVAEDRPSEVFFDNEDLINFFERTQSQRQQLKKQSLIREMLNLNSTKHKSPLAKSNKDADLEFIHSKVSKHKQQSEIQQLGAELQNVTQAKDDAVLLNLTEYFDFKQFNKQTIRHLRQSIIQNAMLRGIPQYQIEALLDSIERANANQLTRDPVKKDIQNVWISQRHVAKVIKAQKRELLLDEARREFITSQKKQQMSKSVESQKLLHTKNALRASLNTKLNILANKKVQITKPEDAPVRNPTATGYNNAHHVQHFHVQDRKKQFKDQRPQQRHEKLEKFIKRSTLDQQRRMQATPDKVRELHGRHTFEIRKLRRPVKQRSSFQILSSMGIKSKDGITHTSNEVRNSNNLRNSVDKHTSLSADEDHSQQEITNDQNTGDLNILSFQSPYQQYQI